MYARGGIFSEVGFQTKKFVNSHKNKNLNATSENNLLHAMLCTSSKFDCVPGKHT